MKLPGLSKTSIRQLDQSKKKKTEPISVTSTLFEGMVVLFIQGGRFGPVQLKHCTHLVQTHGGIVKPHYSSEVTHIISEFDRETLRELLNLEMIPDSQILERFSWITLCVQNNRLEPITVQQRRIQQQGSAIHNQELIQELEKILCIYQDIDDEYRAVSIADMIAKISRLSEPIRSVPDGLGTAVTEMIQDFLTSGTIGKRIALENDKRVQSIRNLLKTPGATPRMASVWYQNGITP